MVIRWTLVCAVAAALCGGLLAQSGKYCMQFHRKDSLDIWYANTDSQLCRDQEYRAPPSGASDDLQLVVSNRSMRIVVDKGYTSLDDHFLTARDANFSVLIYSGDSKDRLELTFDMEQADKNSSLIRTMSYSEEGEGHSKIRRWTVYLYSNNLVNECNGCRDLLFNLFQASYYFFFLLHIFFPEQVSAEFVLLYVSFSVFTQLPLQQYLLYFGYMANFIVESVLSIILAWIVNKVPKFLRLPYSFSAAMIAFYVVGRPYEFPLTVIEVIIALVPAYLVNRELQKKKVQIDQNYRRPNWRLLWISLVILLPLVSYSPIVVLETIMNKRPGYSGAGKTWWQRFTIATMNAVITMVACLFVPKVDRRLSNIAKSVACKDDLIEEELRFKKKVGENTEAHISIDESPMPSICGKGKSKTNEEEEEAQDRQIPVV